MFLDVSSYKVWRKAKKKKKNGTHKEIIAVSGTICFVLVRRIHQSCFFPIIIYVMSVFMRDKEQVKPLQSPTWKLGITANAFAGKRYRGADSGTITTQDILIVRSSFTSDFIDKVAKQALICGPTENFKTSQMRSKTSRESHWAMSVDQGQAFKSIISAAQPKADKSWPAGCVSSTCGFVFLHTCRSALLL